MLCEGVNSRREVTLWTASSRESRCLCGLIGPQRNHSVRRAPGFKFTQSPNTEPEVAIWQKVGLCLTGSSQQASHSLANGCSAYLNSHAVTYRNTQWPHSQGGRSKSDEWDRCNWLATLCYTVKQLNLEKKRKTLEETLEKLGNILISVLSAGGISWWLKRLLI